MALDAATAQELIRKLAADRDAYLESVNKTTELLLQAIAASGNALLPRLPTGTSRRDTISTLEVESVHKSSTFSGEEDSDSDHGECFYTQTPLQSEAYEEDGLREHLRNYPWTEEGKKILHGVLGNEHLLRKQPIFPTRSGPQADRSHLSHYSIFDVGEDGAPLSIRSPFDRSSDSKSIHIWNRLRNTNSDPGKQRKAVGRITIVREPSPLLFGALHYTMNKHFDMDEMFKFLVDHDPVLAHPHRAFAADDRHQRTFIINMEYFTIIGEGCEPPHWQHADEGRGRTDTHVPISRCSATVALSFEGPPACRVRNKNRRVQRKSGQVFDPFSAWRVLSIQCYPDWHSSIETHDSTKHYVNGPEAFLVTVRTEFRDAAKRLMAVYRTITDLIEPPADFIFNLDTRDKLLFEDTNFTYSRRYFWASQTLGIMNQDIRDMVEAYYEAFKDGVWDGTDKVIWPCAATVETSSRRTNWQKRMALLRKEIGVEITRLEEIERLNEKRMRVIKGLHDNLFSGTSVHESRRSVEQAAITVEQGRNIKLLTVVTIFFLPLTFVTSIYGMTAMPTNEPFYHFAYTTLAICIPTYILIGSLITQRGLNWWKARPKTLLSFVLYGLATVFNLFGYRSDWTKSICEGGDTTAQKRVPPGRLKTRSQSTEAAMLTREAIGRMPFLSPQMTKDTPLGTDTPEQMDGVSALPLGIPRGQMEGLHKASSPTVKFHTNRSGASFPTGNSVELKEINPINPATVTATRSDDSQDAEKQIEAEEGSITDRIANLRKGSLAGFLEFWDWQKGVKERAQQPDPC